MTWADLLQATLVLLVSLLLYLHLDFLVYLYTYNRRRP